MLFNGVCLAREVHEEFHRQYGKHRKAFLHEGFKEFCQGYGKLGVAEVPLSVCVELVDTLEEGETSRKVHEGLGRTYFPVLASEITLNVGGVNDKARDLMKKVSEGLL